MKRIRALLTRVVLLGVVAASSPHRTRGEDGKPPMPTKDSVNVCYQGTVTEVTKDSITILWPGEKTPKKFELSEILASGAFPIWFRPRLTGGNPDGLWPSYRYRPQDVKVGDLVYIFYSHIGTADICDAIRISRRPGGRVPPLPDGAENLTSPEGVKRIPYHEEINAFLDWSEHNITYPAKFGKGRRFGVAPMPREVKVPPAVAP